VVLSVLHFVVISKLFSLAGLRQWSTGEKITMVESLRWVVDGQDIPSSLRWRFCRRRPETQVSISSFGSWTTGQQWLETAVAQHHSIWRSNPGKTSRPISSPMETNVLCNALTSIEFVLETVWIVAGMSIIPCSVRHLCRSNEYKDNRPLYLLNWYILICTAHVHISVTLVRVVRTH
jgi:hypothetical protein